MEPGSAVLQLGRARIRPSWGSAVPGDALPQNMRLQFKSAPDGLMQCLNALQSIGHSRVTITGDINNLLSQRRDLVHAASASHAFIRWADDF